MHHHRIRSMHSDERGASLIEYSLLLALITVACLGALNYFGQENGGSVNRSACEVVEATGGNC